LLDGGTVVYRETVIAVFASGLLSAACGGTAPTPPTTAAATFGTPAQSTASPSFPATFKPVQLGTLAYQTWDGEPHLHLRNGDGTNDRLLADGAHPDWSPDGSQVAYEVDSKDIWVIGADGSNARRVFDCQEPCMIGDSPAWSPDGKAIAFTTADATNGHALTGRIVAVDVTTGDLKTLVETTGPDYPFYPRWSPDGKSIVISIQRFATTGTEDCQTTGSAIATVDLDAETPTPSLLTDVAMFADYPDWSPDGSTLVFTTYDLGIRDACTIDPAQSSDLYTVQPDGSGLTQLTHNPAGSAVIRNRTATGPLATQPTWTPDGGAIVFNMVDGPVWPGYQVWTINPDGSNAAQVGSGPPIVGSHPRFRPLP